MSCHRNYRELFLPVISLSRQMESVPGARPPAKEPYRMAPVELEELRKQLEELNEVK